MELNIKTPEDILDKMDTITFVLDNEERYLYANKALENLELPEDEEKRGKERVQELINEYNKVIEDKLKDKEKDLMTI